MKKIRSALDTLYAASGAAAVLFLVLIALLTLAQIGGRLIGTPVPEPSSVTFILTSIALFAWRLKARR